MSFKDKTLHERFRAMLCDPQGKVSIHGSKGDLKIIQKLLEELKSMEDIRFIYLVRLNDGKEWAFKTKKEAVDLMENCLHMKKDKVGNTWGIKGYQNKAELIELIIS